MALNWYPVINYDLCNECLACVKHCTHEVYDLNDLIPTILHPDGCIKGCRGCQNKCQQKAISYFGDGGLALEISCHCKSDCCN